MARVRREERLRKASEIGAARVVRWAWGVLDVRIWQRVKNGQGKREEEC